jgi:hypothetical protein
LSFTGGGQEEGPRERGTTALRAALLASAALGRQVAALLDTETPVPGVTCGDIRPDLRPIGAIARVDGKPINPDAGDLDLTAGWGHAGQGGVTMPGRGRTERSVISGQCSDDGDMPGREPRASSLVPGASPTVNREPGTLAPNLPAPSLDVYLNDVACWRNLPLPVWDYTLGGYQVIKKWLSYREKALLGRGLTIAEARYVTEMARRIAALLALRDELDGNCRAAATRD